MMIYLDIKRKDKYILFLFTTFSFIFFIKFCFFCFKGLDYTDEIAYLYAISDPWFYNETASQFGLIYYPLYKLFNGDIGLLRAITFIILISMSYFLLLAFFDWLKPVNSKLTPGIKRLLAFNLATTSLIIYLLWLPTPNYNLLNFQGLVLVSLGLLQAVCNLRKDYYKVFSVWTGWLLIGFGGWLSFMAKPQSAAAIAVIVTIWGLFSRDGTFKARVRGLIAAAVLAICLVLATALVLDGSFGTFSQRYLKAVEVERLVGSHEVGKLYYLNWHIIKTFLTLKIVLLWLILPVFGFLVSLSIKKNNFKLTLTMIIVLSLMFFTIYKNLSLGYIAGHFLWLLPFGGILFLLFSYKKTNKRLNIRNIEYYIFFIVLWLIYGLGSNNSILITTSLSSFFLFLGFLGIILENTPSNLWFTTAVGFTVCGQIAVIALTHAAWSTPYRQDWPLERQKSRVAVGGSILKLSPRRAVFVYEWRQLAVNSGFVAGTPVMDFTGRSPGSVYVMGGRLPSRTPWVFSGYRGSEAFALRSINLLDCRDLAEAWLVLDADAPPAYDVKLLEAALGDRDYELQGTVKYLNVDSRLNLLKPLRPPAERAEVCRANRAGQSDISAAGG
jgi:hypothetical protein